MKQDYPNKMKEFYLDINRYTFNLLFDNDLKQIIIAFSDEEETKAMRKLVRNAFFNQSKHYTNYVSLNIASLGVEVNYVEASTGMSFKEYEDIMFRYAYKDDKEL